MNWQRCSSGLLCRVACSAMVVAFLLGSSGSLLALPAGPSPIPSIFDPYSTPAHDIYHLSLFVLSICAVIFLVVFSLIIYAAFKYRHRPTDDDCEPPQIYGSNQVELAWTVIPIMIVVVLFLASARVIHAVEDAQFPPDAIEVTATGHQFWWEFEYPKYGIVTANELHVPVSANGQSLPTSHHAAFRRHGSQLLGSAAGRKDGLDSEPPQQNVDRAPRGWTLCRPVRAVLRNAARQDAAACYVQSPEDFQRWAQEQKAPAVMSPQVAEGRHVFESNACMNCHTITGTNANGRFGPDLTHLMSRKTMASGAAPNDEQIYGCG